MRPTREIRPRAILSSGLGGSLTASGTGEFETVDEGGNPDSLAHGSMGTTETVDAADGNHHTGTLNANCTVTVAAFADGSIVFVVTQDSTGGWDITWSGVTFAGDDQPEQGVGEVTVFALLSSGGTVYGFKAGGAGGNATAASITAVGARGELLLKDGHSTPPVFDDILVNDDLSDFLYADLVDP